MSQPEEYEVLILGSGAAGKQLPWAWAAQGKRTALVERQYVGGACPNIACLPSKNIIHSAKVASFFRRREEFGIHKDNWQVDMAGVRARKRRMVEDLVQLHLGLYKKSGAELLIGSGRVVGPKTLEVALAEGGHRTLRGETVIISTGRRARFDAVPGLREARPLTHVEALELGEVPEHLLVLGGGYVGLELAQAMRRFGSQVTIIDRNDRLLHREDADFSEALAALCHDEDITLCLGARITQVEGLSGQLVRLTGKAGNGADLRLEGTHLLVASGRVPNTDGIGLALAGVALTAQGYVQVNERLKTTAPGVWAVGDCAGSPQFTHIAADDFRVVRANVAGGHRVTASRQVPFCVFTDPQFARVGLSETEAKAQGIAYRLATLPMATVLRTRTISEPRGFLKAPVAADSDRILGFAAFGAGAGELLPVVQLAMSAGLPYPALRDLVMAHPTMAEAIPALFGAVPAKAAVAAAPAQAMA